MIEIFADGGSRGNPGQAAYGYLVKVDGQLVKEGAGAIGIATNNFAEYTAVIQALRWLEKSNTGQDIAFYLDSKLVVSQLSGLYKVKNATIRNLVLEIRGLEASFGQVSYHFLPREENRQADRLVNEILDRNTKNGT